MANPRTVPIHDQEALDQAIDLDPKTRRYIAELERDKADLGFTGHWQNDDCCDKNGNPIELDFD